MLAKPMPVWERSVGTKKSERISQLWLLPRLAAAQLACSGGVRARLVHAEHLNVENGSFRSFNGVTVFVCESELGEEGGKWRDGR